MAAKAHLRHRLLAQRAALTPVEIQQKSAVITSHVCTLPAFGVTQTLMVYMSLPQEVQTVAIIAEARRQGKRVAIPVIRGRELVAVELPPAMSQLRRGPYGILEPREVTPAVSGTEIACVLVPGVAFDRRGGRIGFGKGYYDRFLPQLQPAACTCGLAFAMQLVPCVPMTPQDVRMHYIITEQGVIPCEHALLPAGDRQRQGKGEHHC